MSRPRAPACPSAAQPNAAGPAPRHPVPIPFADGFRPVGVPPPAPYPAPFYPFTMRHPPVFPPVRPPACFPRPHVYLPPPPSPGGIIGHPGPQFHPFVLVVPGHTSPHESEPHVCFRRSDDLTRPLVCFHDLVVFWYITQYPVYQQPLGFPPRPINPPIGVLSHQRPALIDGTFGPVTVARPPITPVAPANEPEFKVFVGKIASTVESDFVLSLLQVCGVVISWNPVTNPIDGTRTAFGFCDFESAEGSLRAKRLLNKLSIDGQELVLTVSEATEVYLQKFGGNTTEENAKEAETETRDGMASVADNGNDSSRAIPDLMKRGAIGGQMSSQGKLKRRRYGTEEYSDSDKEAMQKISIMIEERMKSKFPCLSTPPAQPSANIIDENGDNDTSSALEEGEISGQCETEEQLRESRAVGLQGRKDGEVSAAGKSSLQIDAVSSMHVSMERESTVEHERKRQQGEREFHMNSVEDRMKSKFPCLSTPSAQPSANIIDEKCDNDTSSSALEEGEISGQSETEEQLRESRAVSLQGRNEGEVSAARESSLQIDAVSSMHVSMERESTVGHERKRQQGEREFCMKSDEDRMKSKFPCLSTPPAQPSANIIDEEGDNDTRSSALEDGEISRQGETEEQLRESRAASLQGRNDGEVRAAGESSLQIDTVSSMHVSMERESTVEQERKRQHGEREFHMNSDEEKGIACLPGLVSDKHNSSAPGEKVDLESQATSKSGNEETLDAKQLLAAVPKTKEELFAYDVNWAIYDKHGLHEKMRPWISEKTAEIFGEEIPEFVEYVVASTKEHVEAPRMLEALASLMDHSAEKFALSLWTKLIFEIKKVEAGLA